jgi:cell division transport system permease protein
MTRRNARKEGHRPSAIEVWLMRHAQTFLASLGRLSNAPFATLLTSAVIGVALALPMGMYVILNGVNHLAEDWEVSAGITMFLKKGVEERRATELAASLRSRPGIVDVTLIGAEAALEEFRQHSGLRDALDILEENPLPTVIVLEPLVEAGQGGEVEKLVEELRFMPEAETVQLDLIWLKRFRALTDIAHRATVVLIILFALAVVLITGNTIRLEIRNRSVEIEVIKTVGGTDAFIRRPFLYNGLIYGLLGGLIAWLLIGLALHSLANGVENLAMLYDSDISMHAMGVRDVLTLLGGSTFLGLVGSWMVVGRHIRAIEPT